MTTTADRTSARTLARFAPACIVLAAAIAATAQSADAGVCRTAKLRAEGRGVVQEARCAARALAKGEDADPACFEAAAGALSDAFATAEQPFTCYGDPDAARLAVDTCVAELYVLFPDGAACSSRKLRAASRAVAGTLACHARKDRKRRSPAQCGTAQATALDVAFARAERGGACAGTADLARDRIAGCVERFLDGFQPPSSHCGNDVVEPGEECDGQEFCDPDCEIMPEAAYCCDRGTSEAPLCEDMGTVDNTTCFFGCTAEGGACSFGTCTASGCENVAFPTTSVCCAGSAVCNDTEVSGTGDLAAFRHHCRYVVVADEITVGRCGDEGRCVPAE